MEGKYVRIVFTENTEEIKYINVFSIIKGTDDYFVKLGSVAPPSLSTEELERIDKIDVKPLFMFAMTKSSVKQFIELLQEEYENEQKESKATEKVW